MIEVRYKIWRLDARPPVFAKPGDACCDLHACDDESGILIWPGETRIVYTGISLEIPEGWDGLIRGRSGLSSKGIIVLPGVIDSGYRGRIGVMIHNATRDHFTVSRGDRIAQLAIRQAPEVLFVQVDDLGDTERAGAGFGSTGR